MSSFTRSNNLALLTHFLQTVSDARTSRNAPLLASLLCADPFYVLQNDLMLSLRSELSSNPSALQSRTDKIIGDEWMGFTELVAAYLKYVLNLDPAVLYDTGTSRAWHSSLKTYMGAINPAFNSPQGGVLIPLVKGTAALLTSAALRIDAQIGDPRFGCSHAAMNVLLRTFNSTLGERTLASGAPTMQTLGKKAATLRIANLLFKLYFKLNQIRLCATIHTNINAASIPSYLHLYPKSDRCAYTYYLGRHHFFNAHFTTALSTLTTSYNLTRPADISQRRLLLLYMITSALILGKFPSESLLARPEAHGLAQMFYPICRAIRLGDFRGFRHALGDEGPETWRRQWWIRRELYLALRNRCQILLWRGLIRRTWLITRPPMLSAAQVAEGAKAAPPTVGMWQILVLVRFLHRTPGEEQGAGKGGNPLFLGAEEEDTDEDDDGEEDGEGADEGGYFGLKVNMIDVESAIVSLCDQGFIKGYIARQATGPLIVLGRSGAFPAVAEIYNSSRWKAEGEESGSEEGNGGAMTVNPFAAMGAGGGMGGGGRVVNLSGVRGVGQRAF
ncbi:uncharacterized protein H6S33_004253 [Morchella sextelata]|uniref:uncharacterized protein n=1 Tax=Morchella sextelata TaxID=1174677 RepID=UPI001D05B581|nr:uncharacterized protein H6S33_004253 [Morchella sextelata]KAH0605796.1 hypothetical protein H6S33_004253 [Morchella sextelata]